jgi:hypothetical protein
MDNVEKLRITDNIIERARKRHLLGNPPGSDKVTICDEVIWESILENIRYDIVIVTNDKSFLNNKNFLEDEIAQKDYKLLEITNSITEAIKLIGAEPSQELEQLEKETKEELEAIQISNPFINIAQGRYGFGYQPLTGNAERIDASYYCPNCGKLGPWNGAMCMSCGMRDCGD